MAYSRSFSGWRYRYKYGTRSSRRWKSGSRLRALGNAKAARQQRDAATVTINKIAQITATIPANASASSVIINHWNMLRLSDYFPNYAPMYDQMKLNKIRVKLTGFRAGTAQTANISPAVILAFDRNGLNPGQTVSPALISTYSSAQLKQWSTGNSFSMYQSIYPSTIMEKGQYIPTGSLDDPSDNEEPSNPCTNESDSTLPFKPISLLSVDLGATVGAAAQTFAFTAEFEYTVTFRGMRKPSLSSSPVLVPFADTLTSNGRYRVTAEQAGVDGWNSVDILVNVPTGGSDVMFDRVTFVGSNVLNVYDIDGPSILFSSLTPVTQSFTLSLPPGSLTVIITQMGLVISGTMYNVYVRTIGDNGTATSMTVNAGSYYTQVSASILTGTYSMPSLASGSDLVFFGERITNGTNSINHFNAQGEDISILN